METETKEPPKALNVRAQNGFRLWVVIVVRSNGELEALSPTYPSQPAAAEFAQRCYGWMKGVQVGVAPVIVDAGRLEVFEEPGELRITSDAAGQVVIGSSLEAKV